jgi:hypothetical protein
LLEIVVHLFEACNYQRFYRLKENGQICARGIKVERIVFCPLMRVVGVKWRNVAATVKALSRTLRCELHQQ